MPNENAFLAQIKANETRGRAYVDDVLRDDVESPLRLIAFYLPQFHPIPENDQAWGKGFTEWTNVSKALPRFLGHYQPRLPGELGFYDLRLVDNIRRQARLATRYGIGGFCFHYYWFNGKRLLETPLNLLLANPDIDIPFCVNWANENWTRRWDGGNGEVILAQRHSPEDDLAFAHSLEPLMRDRRYIRINGRPLLLIYRAGLLPNAAQTVERWRRHLESAGLGNPYIAMCQSFKNIDPRIHGIDAAVGFPPHEVGWVATNISASVTGLDPQFRGRVKSYEGMASKSGAMPKRDYTFFHGICPGWDNTPRQPFVGSCFAGSTPQSYGAWLTQICRRTLDEHVGDERIVFINAWNEWAEGAYLEPDRHFGYAYLAETARVVGALDPGGRGGGKSPRKPRSALASPPPRAPSQSEPSARLYLDLLESSLCNLIYRDGHSGFGSEHDFDAEKRDTGRDWPKLAHTMIGRVRLSHLRRSVEQLLAENIPGDLIETGVWRGGASILMRGVLAAHGVTDRIVHLADSFKGLPPPDIENYPADAGSTLHESPELAVSRAQVEDAFRRYGLLDGQVRFHEGWFKDTLPRLGDERFALIRLDGDMWESTWTALSELYPRLNQGGFAVIDDYNCFESCRLAVDEYRTRFDITAPMEKIDWSGVCWRKL